MHVGRLFFGEEGEPFERIVMNHQISKTQTIVESCANQTGTPQKQCVRILWNLIMATLGHSILEELV